MKAPGSDNGLDRWQPVIADLHPNFRMLGGVSQDGRRLRRGAFLRGPALHELDAQAWRALPDVELSLVVDFRRADEVSDRPIRLPRELQGSALALPIDSGAVVRHHSDGNGGGRGTDATATMVAVYRDFVGSHLGTYATFLRRVAGVSRGGVFFHCTAGKDRTGFAAALILLALGVPREQVMADFLATGALWQPDPQLAARVAPAARPAIFGVNPAYLDAALDELERAAGGARAFAARAMGGEATLQDWVDANLV